MQRPTSSFWDCFDSPDLTDGFKIPHVCKGAIRGWLDGGDAREVSRDLNLGSLFGLQKQKLSLRTQATIGEF